VAGPRSGGAFHPNPGVCPTTHSVPCATHASQVPYFNGPIYLENKTLVGKVEEIFGPINSSYFTIKMADGVVATSYAHGDKFYIAPDKLLPMERFTNPEKCVPGATQRTKMEAAPWLLLLALVTDIAPARPIAPFCDPGAAVAGAVAVVRAVAAVGVDLAAAEAGLAGVAGDRPAAVVAAAAGASRPGAAEGAALVAAVAPLAAGGGEDGGNASVALAQRTPRCKPHMLVVRGCHVRAGQVVERLPPRGPVS
jgi:rRNA processing protein Gar1